MLPGPVFSFELMMTARRGRLYLIRASYALLLLAILWAAHSAWTSETGGVLSSRQVKFFGLPALLGIAIGQELLVLALTPAMVAGVIADERQRKTLHYLMASQLTSSEIVLGKLLARMLYMAVLLGVSLPVLSLLVLMGGIDPKLVMLVCAATLTTAWFVAALSIWASTVARRVRDAFLIAYGLEGIWLLSPAALRGISVPVSSFADNFLTFFIDWVGTSSPAEIARGMLFNIGLGGGSLSSELESIAWMMGLQTAFGLILAVLAAIQLRPTFRAQDGESGTRVLRGTRAVFARLGRKRISQRPVFAQRPMLWKELYTGGPRGFARFVGFLLTVIGGGFLIYYTIWNGALAFDEMWNSSSATVRRSQFFWFLRFVAPLLYMSMMVAIAAVAAAAVTSEHEEDTWVSLTSTDLTGREIVFAKLRGAMERGYRISAVLVMLALAGVVCGSVHILSVPALMVALPVYGWFAAALGIWISMQLRSTWRAQFLTIACLILLNVIGQGFLNMISQFGFAPQVWPGFTPYEISKLFFDPLIIQELNRASSWPTTWAISSVDDGFAWLAILSVASLLGYASLAALLTWHALRRFEVVAGRARRRNEKIARELRGMPDPNAGPLTTCPST
jgi:ABC-type transport system involved in multi-copper enzyme maturation permease subunit